VSGIGGLSVERMAVVYFGREIVWCIEAVNVVWGWKWSWLVSMYWWFCM